MSSQSLKKCSSFPLPPALIEQLQAAWDLKKDVDEIALKRARTVDDAANRPASISVQLSAQARPLVDAAILEFLIMQGISVHVVNSPEFLNMVRKIRDAGANYAPPNRHALGKDGRADNEMGLGGVLFSEFIRLKRIKQTLLSGVSVIGGTLCSDGAKWRKRNCLNSVLHTSFGPFFCQSTGILSFHFHVRSFSLRGRAGSDLKLTRGILTNRNLK
jgi:hypothetical protein